jgi:hypothetical protein
MTRTTMSLHFALIFAAFGISLPTLAPAPANAQNQNMEVIHHSNYDKNVFMPFVPAIKIKSGKILYGSLALQRCRSITTIRISVMRSKSTWSMI